MIDLEFWFRCFIDSIGAQPRRRAIPWRLARHNPVRAQDCANCETKEAGHTEADHMHQPDENAA
jgi:hypothetical protein